MLYKHETHEGWVEWHLDTIWDTDYTRALKATRKHTTGIHKHTGDTKILGKKIEENTRHDFWLQQPTECKLNAKWNKQVKTANQQFLFLFGGRPSLFFFLPVSLSRSLTHSLASIPSYPQNVSPLLPMEKMQVVLLLWRFGSQKKQTER